MESDDITKKLFEMQESITKNTESTKSAHKRLDEVVEKVEDIHELASSVKTLATEMKAMREDFSKMDSRIKIIEEKPGKT